MTELDKTIHELYISGQSTRKIAAVVTLRHQEVYRIVRQLGIIRPKQLSPEVEQVCPICQKKYTIKQYVLEGGKGTTCSRECSYILRGKQKEKKIEVECERCGQKMIRRPCEIKTKVLCVNCYATPKTLPVGHICNSWTVISEEYLFITFRSVCRHDVMITCFFNIGSV